MEKSSTGSECSACCICLFFLLFLLAAAMSLMSSMLIALPYLNRATILTMPDKKMYVAYRISSMLYAIQETRQQHANVERYY